MPITVATDQLNLVSATGLMTRGTVTANGTTQGRTLLSAASATTRWYVCGLQFMNTSSTQSIATFNDSVSSQFGVNGTSAFGFTFPVPLAFGLASAVVFSMSASATTIIVCGQAFQAP